MSSGGTSGMLEASRIVAEEVIMIATDEYQRAENDHQLLADARRRRQIHFTVFLFVNAGLIILNTLLVVFTEAEFIWFPFVLAGWAIGLQLIELRAALIARKRQRIASKRIAGGWACRSSPRPVPDPQRQAAGRIEGHPAAPDVRLRGKALWPHREGR